MIQEMSSHVALPEVLQKQRRYCKSVHEKLPIITFAFIDRSFNYFIDWHILILLQA